VKRGIALTVALVVCGAGAADDKALAEIPVVATYGDLLALTPTKLEGGVTVRLGIEAKECRALCGVLLYCLTEGYEPQRESRDVEYRCGPLRVHVASDVFRKEKVRSMHGRQDTGGVDYKKCKVLFVKSIIARAEGSWRITAAAPNGPVIGSATLEAKKAEYHPWVSFRWADADDGAEPAELVEADDDETAGGSPLSGLLYA
jgi:hypothetical protein